MTTEFFWLHPSRVCNQQSSVIRHQLFLQLHRTIRIDVLGVVRNKGLGDGLPDSVHLRCMPSSFHTNPDIDGGKRILSCDKDWLVNLKAEDFWLNEVYGRTVDTDESTAFFCMSNCSCGLWPSKPYDLAEIPQTCLLFAESLNGLCC